METNSQQRINLLRANLLPLTEACPVDQGNPPDCPLHNLRQMKPAVRFAWINNLPEEDLGYLVSYHQICANQKLAAANTCHLPAASIGE